MGSKGRVGSFCASWEQRPWRTGGRLPRVRQGGAVPWLRAQEERKDTQLLCKGWKGAAWEAGGRDLRPGVPGDRVRPARGESPAPHSKGTPDRQ